MRKPVFLVLVTALVLALFAGVVQAKDGSETKGNSSGKGKSVASYNFKGEVAAVGEGSITVSVEKGNKAARTFVGQQVEILVSDTTNIKKDDAPAVLADIAVGDDVKAQVRAPKNSPGDFTARKIAAETPEVEEGTTEEAPVEETVPAT